MSALASMTIANWPAFAKGLIDAQKLQLRFMRTEMKRGAQRIRKTFIREQLKGPPGIKAGLLAKGKNIWTHVQGDKPELVAGKIGISRILHVHEKGMTIPETPGSAKTKSGMLYLHEKGKRSPIIAVVPQVKIPARLKFEKLVHRESPKVLLKVGEAGARGVEVALTKALKKTI